MMMVIAARPPSTNGQELQGDDRVARRSYVKNNITCMPFIHIYLPEWNLSNIAGESCKTDTWPHLPDFDVIKVKSFEECTTKSEAYEYVRFLENKEGSEEYKCFRHHICYGPSVTQPGSSYKKFSVYHLDYSAK